MPISRDSGIEGKELEAKYQDLNIKIERLGVKKKAPLLGLSNILHNAF